MERKRIRQAAEVAQRLADQLAEVVRLSVVPPAYWDEVVELLRGNLQIPLPREIWHTQAEAIATLFDAHGASAVHTGPRDTQSDLQKLIEASAKHIQLNAMFIAELPVKDREVVYQGIEARIRDSIRVDGALDPLKDEWLTALMSDLRWYVEKIDAGGGAQGGNA